MKDLNEKRDHDMITEFPGKNTKPNTVCVSCVRIEGIGNPRNFVRKTPAIDDDGFIPALKANINLLAYVKQAL